MRIQKVVQCTGITKRTIYYYVQEGLLSPVSNSNTEETNTYYDFSEKDCQRLLLIRSFRNAGFPIGEIRDILNNPTILAYYLKKREKDLQIEADHIADTLTVLREMQWRLSPTPDQNEVLSLAGAFPFPARAEKETPDFYVDHTLLNRLFWKPFLNEAPFDEYQEFLWQKINRRTNEADYPDYRLLCEFFAGLTQEQIRPYFEQGFASFKEILALTPEKYQSYAMEMIRRIGQFLNSPEAVAGWKQNYSRYYLPSIRTYHSEVSRIMTRLSPRFADFSVHLNAVCKIAYDWLQSEEGSSLQIRLHRLLDPDLDLENYDHGQLHALSDRAMRDIRFPQHLFQR